MTAGPGSHGQIKRATRQTELKDAGPPVEDDDLLRGVASSLVLMTVLLLSSIAADWLYRGPTLTQACLDPLIIFLFHLMSGIHPWRFSWVRDRPCHVFWLYWSTFGLTLFGVWLLLYPSVELGKLAATPAALARLRSRLLESSTYVKLHVSWVGSLMLHLVISCGLGWLKLPPRPRGELARLGCAALALAHAFIFSCAFAVSLEGTYAYRALTGDSARVPPRLTPPPFHYVLVAAAAWSVSLLVMTRERQMRRRPVVLGPAKEGS